MTPRSILTALLALILLGGGAGARIPAKRHGVWAQGYVDRLPDPAIRFGQLPNGLRYAILRNETPAGQMSLRLVIGSGSLAEPAGSEGLAHFLEHMAFRGSAHVADGEMMRILERKGLKIGPDTNASTTPEATVYQFDFPQSGADSIDTGLMLFREVAGELTIDAKAVDAERGVVLSEERLRDGPGYRAAKANLGFTLAGQLAPDRLPIGKVEVIQHAPAALIRAFYEAHYRPDNAAIVAVGDFDPATIEAQIKVRFADWRPKAAPGARPAPGRPAARGEQARLFIEPGAPTSTQIAWVRPFDDRADTGERTRDDLDRLTATLILNQRLGDIARRVDAPFLGAGVNQSNVLESANVTSLSIAATGDRQLGAMRAAVDEQRRALRYGFSQPELDRALAALNAGVSAAASGAATRPTPALANRMVRDILTDEVTRSPAQDLADLQSWSRFVTLKEINATLKGVFAGSGPLLFLSAPQPLPGGEQALMAAFDDANRDKVEAAAAGAVAAWPYTNFGAPGTVANRRAIADLGVTIVTFANGVTLVVKPTSFAKGEVLVDASFGRGRLGLPRDRAHAYWMVGGVPVFTEGGTGKVPAGEIQRMMAGKMVGVHLEMEDTSYELIGHSRADDLNTQLQIMTAYLSDPGFRPEAVTRVQGMLGTVLPQLESTPEGVANRDLGPLIHSGDPRWSKVPTADQLARSKPQDLIAILDPELSSPVAVTIVGDVTVEQAIAAVAPTLGALPPRDPRPAPASGGIAFPAPTAQRTRLLHSGRADQAIAFAAWPTRGFYDSPADARALVVAAGVIQRRLFDQLREAQGTTYSPDVNAAASTTIAGYGFVGVTVELPPAKIAGFYAMADAIAADLRARPVGADELERARRPLVESRTRDRENNAYWIATLPNVLRDPRELDAIRTRVSGIEQVTAAEIQRVAARYLIAPREYRLTIEPRAEAK